MGEFILKYFNIITFMGLYAVNSLATSVILPPSPPVMEEIRIRVSDIPLAVKTDVNSSKTRYEFEDDEKSWTLRSSGLLLIDAKLIQGENQYLENVRIFIKKPKINESNQDCKGPVLGPVGCHLLPQVYVEDPTVNCEKQLIAAKTDPEVPNQITYFVIKSKRGSKRISRAPRTLVNPSPIRIRNFLKFSDQNIMFYEQLVQCSVEKELPQEVVVE